MSIHQHAAIEDTLYFWFASNDTSGSGGDGSTPLADVRLAGAAAGAAPVLSPTPTLLSHANYPAGCYEVSVAATTGNGFAAGNTYSVFCTLTIDSQNPSGFVGSFTLDPIRANIIEISDDSGAANNLEADYDGTGYAKTNSTIGTTTTNTDMRGTDNAALASVLGALTDAAAAGDPTTADTVMQYIKQLINVLIGTTGVTTFPAEAAPANNISLAEVIRAIHADVTGLNGDAMRGTDSAALAADYTSARAGYLDNINGHTAQTGDNYARLGAPAGASVSADIAAVQADTDDIQTRLPSALTTGTADSGTTTTMVDAALTEADTDYWAGNLIRFTSGNISGQTRLITGFTPASDTITFTPATTQAVSTHNYEILPWGAVDVRQWVGVAPNALVSGAVDADVSAIQAGAITSAAIATDAVDADALAADAATEIRDAVTGGAYALDTDANGRIRIVDGTGAGELDTDTGTVLLRAATEAQIDAIETDTNALNDTKIPDTISLAAINAEVDTALSDINLDHFVGTATGIPAVPAGTYLDQIMDDGTASFDRTTDSLQAIRDRGDTSWITGGGGGITDILNITPLIPESIDLANTATWTIGLQLTNALDDLPTTAEITPGTIDIDRKAIGGTSWTSVVAGAACSEAAGLIYYDEVFDAGTGYAEGDSIRITFYNQQITVAANDYEISDATGRIFYTEIRQTMRGTDSANTTTPPTAVAIRSEIDSNSTQLAAIVADTNELQTDWADAGRLDAILDARASQATADAIETDTQDIQTRLPAALVTGRMSSDAVAISGSTAAADNLQASAETIVTGTAQTGTLSTTQMTSDLSETTDDHYIGRIIIWTSGALLYQATDITDYSGTNGLLTFTAVTEAPSNGDTFVIV